MNPAALARLPAGVRDVFVGAFTGALNTIFVVAAAITVIAFALSFALRQLPLRETVGGGAGVGEAFAAPKETASRAELSRALSVLSRRDGARTLIERAAARADVELDARACWLLARLAHDPSTDVEALGARHGDDTAALRGALDALRRNGLVADDQALTASGHATLDRLTATSQARLDELAEGWRADEHPELADLIRSLAREFLLDASALERRPAPVG